MKRFLLLFLLYTVSCLVGATLGALVFANISDFLMYVLEVRFRGFYSLLIDYLLFIGGVLGAFTGFIVALSHTGYRKAAAWLGGILLLGVLIFIGLRAPHDIRLHGRRFVLSIEGLAFCWAMALAWWSVRRAVAHVVPQDK